jgi:hypothetical protein
MLDSEQGICGGARVEQEDIAGVVDWFSLPASLKRIVVRPCHASMAMPMVVGIVTMFSIGLRQCWR